MDLDAAIAVLMGHADRGAVVKALTDSAQPIYQAIFDKGHAAATARKAEDVAEVQRRLDAASATIQTMERELEKLKGEQPEASKLHDQYKSEIEQLKESHKKDVAKLREAIGTERLRRAQADLKVKLTSGRKDYGDAVLEDAYADVLIQHPDTLKRLKFTDDGRLEVLQAGKDIPLQVGDGQEPINLLAQELKQGANPKLIVSNVGTGSGENGTTGASGGGKNFYDTVRDNVKKEQEAKRPTNKSAAERLGVPTGA